MRRAVKIEAGAKSALDPNSPVTVKPYVSDELPGTTFNIENVRTVQPVRSFWDKVVILFDQILQSIIALEGRVNPPK